MLFALTCELTASQNTSPDIFLQARALHGAHFAIHTWSHPYMTSLSNEQVVAEVSHFPRAVQAYSLALLTSPLPPDLRSAGQCRFVAVPFSRRHSLLMGRYL